MKSDYYERQERRLERAEELAEKNRAIASEKWESPANRQLRDMGGEPIKIGHHSEGRHRALINRANRDWDQAREATDKAAHYDGKVASIERTLNGKGAISSDAPDAIDRLREKIADRERYQDRMKAANLIIRSKPKNEGTPEKLEKLEALGIGHLAAVKLFQEDFCGRVGYPGYELTNNNANIRRMKQRLAGLERQEEAETVEREENGVKIVENAEENRLQLFFDGKPAAEIRTALKRSGFRWAPSVGAWQRMLNNGSRYAAKYVLAKVAECVG